MLVLTCHSTDINLAESSFDQFQSMPQSNHKSWIKGIKTCQKVQINIKLFPSSPVYNTILIMLYVLVVAALLSSVVAQYPCYDQSEYCEDWTSQCDLEVRQNGSLNVPLLTRFWYSFHRKIVVSRISRFNFCRWFVVSALWRAMLALPIIQWYWLLLRYWLLL